jgi:hypothetical protein
MFHKWGVVGVFFFSQMLSLSFFGCEVFFFLEMMDSPAQRTLRLASEFSLLYCVLAIYGVYVDSSLLALMWKIGVVYILQRAIASLKKLRANRSGGVDHIVDIEDFPGLNYVSPSQHTSPAARVCRAVAMHGIPLLMHLFVYLGHPLHNDNAFPAVGGVMTDFVFAALQRDREAAGDMPAAALRWQATSRSTKFWFFTAAPELVSLDTFILLDVGTIVILYIVLCLLVAAAGGALPPHGLVQLLPLRDSTPDERRDEARPSAREIF